MGKYIEVMKLSIIIVNYKSFGLTRQCVRGIFSDTTKVELEVIVVDNASGDGCVEWLTQHEPRVKTVALPTNLGYAAGCNAGMKVAHGEYLVILNPDITILPHTLAQLAAFMDTHPKVGLAGPRLVNPDGSLQYSAYQFPSFWLPLFRRTTLGLLPRIERKLHQYQLIGWDHHDNRRVDWLLGACLIVRRSALTDFGPMDERYFLYVEDTDWCRACWHHGWEVWYVAEVELVHFHERLSAQATLVAAFFSRITWIHIGSWIKYFLKWRGTALPPPG